MSANNADAELVKQQCLRYLTLREYSQAELFSKLSLKGYASATCLDVLAELVEKDWQSDLRFAQSYCRQRINKGYGPLRIESELRQRGVEGFNVYAFIEQMEKNWLDLIQQVYLKKYTAADSVTRKEWAKRSRFLQQRGFSFDLIQALFNQLEIKLI